MEKYRTERVVGEGSFGKALLCVRKADNRKCIIKEISLAKMGAKEAKMTEQESALLARLQHPNIVTFWESFLATKNRVKNLYIVMDFADGGDLSNLIKTRNGRLMPESQVVTLSVQICLAIKHIHDRKILHRDLKCANIFLTKRGIVKLGDFGIAKVLRGTSDLASTQIGTPYFMSPEILENKRYNNKTDIWSLGCVIYELMRLKVPFDGTSMRHLVSNIINKPMPSLPAQFTRELRHLVQAMLAKKHRDRPSVNTILTMPVFRAKISDILEDNVKQQEFSHTVLHGGNILKQAPLDANANPTPVSKPEKPVEEPPQKPKVDAAQQHRDNRLLAAQARAEAGVMALKKAQLAAQEKKEKERAAVVQERERLAREKLRKERREFQEKVQAAEAERVEARKLREKQERAEKEARRVEWEKEQAVRREELQKLRAASEERERERAEEARRKANEARKKAHEDKLKNRDRPWLVQKDDSSSDNHGDEHDKGEGEDAAAVIARKIEDADVGKERAKQDGPAVAKVPRKPAVPKQTPPESFPRAAAKPPPSREEDRAHDQVVEKALARRGRQDVDMDAARERREKFERMRAGRQEEAVEEEAVEDAEAEDMSKDSGADVANESEEEKSPKKKVSAQERRDQHLNEGIAEKLDSEEPLKPLKKKNVASNEWLSNLQANMGNLKNQMVELKSQESSSREGGADQKKAQGFQVGDSPPPDTSKRSKSNSSSRDASRKKGSSKAKRKADKETAPHMAKIAETVEEDESMENVEEARKAKRDKECNDLKRFLKSQRKKNDKLKREMKKAEKAEKAAAAALLPSLSLSPAGKKDSESFLPVLSPPEKSLSKTKSLHKSSSLPPIHSTELGKERGGIFARSKPRLTIDILESAPGGPASPLRVSCDDIDLDRRRTPVNNPRKATQDDINSPRNFSQSRNSPSKQGFINTGLDGSLDGTLDLRKHVARRREKKADLDAGNATYNVENEIEQDLIALGNMTIDDFEYGSMIAAMEEVMNLPQKYTMLLTKEESGSGDGDEEGNGVRFNDDDEFEENDEDRKLVDCVTDGDDVENSGEEAEEDDDFDISGSEDGDSSSDNSSDDGCGSGSENEDKEVVQNDHNSDAQVVDRKDLVNRIAKVRQYLEDCIGPVNFVRAYSLMKVVETSDDDDALLAEMESIVGVEGLHLMDTFINLMLLEDELEAPHS